MCKLNITHSDVFYPCMCSFYPFILNDNRTSYQKDLDPSAIHINHGKIRYPKKEICPTVAIVTNHLPTPAYTLSDL